MLPSPSIRMSGSASSRWGSAGTDAENVSPWASAAGSEGSELRALVLKVSVPV